MLIVDIYKIAKGKCGDGDGGGDDDDDDDGFSTKPWLPSAFALVVHIFLSFPFLYFPLLYSFPKFFFSSQMTINSFVMPDKNLQQMHKFTQFKYEQIN